MAKFCSSTKTIAPMNGPIGWRMPPSTAMIRMLISAPMPIVPGEIRLLYQTIQHAADRRQKAGHCIRRDAVGVDVEAERAMRRGLSRTPCKAMPKGARTKYLTKK